VGKEASDFRFDTRRAVEDFEKRLPLFWGDREIAPIGKNVLGLQAGALENEVRQSYAAKVGASTD